MTVRTAFFQSDGTVAEEVELDGRCCECCATAPVRTRRGMLVAYRDRSADEARDIALVRQEDGRWTKPYRLHPDGWKIAGCPVNGPAMDASEDQVVAAWFTAASDTARVFVRIVLHLPASYPFRDAWRLVAVALGGSFG